MRSTSSLRILSSVASERDPILVWLTMRCTFLFWTDRNENEARLFQKMPRLNPRTTMSNISGDVG